MTFAVGARPVASGSVAAGPLHDPPTVALTAPSGTISSGGPDITVSWTYAQPQGDPQEYYRVRILDGGTPVFDTGILSGADGTLDVDFDAEEIPGDGSYTAEVTVIGANQQATDTGSFTADLGTPALTITAPVDEEVHTDPDSVDVAWSVVDAGHTQAQYRVRLLSPTTSEVLTTTGWVTSTDTSVTVDYVFADNTQVVVEVQTKNENGMRSS